MADHQCLPSHLQAVCQTVHYAHFANETPVTSEIMREVLSDLAKQGVIEVYDKSGSKRRSGVKRGSDIIVPSRQKRLFLPGNPNN